MLPEQTSLLFLRLHSRFWGTRLLTNADMGPAEVRLHCQLDGAGQRLMQAAMRQLHLSARAYHRVLKLSRTITDLAGADDMGPAHLAEAIQYRPRRVEWLATAVTVAKIMAMRYTAATVKTRNIEQR
jgi:predicted ATPase with chaperone activity